MNIKKYRLEVTTTVDIEIDLDKFTPEWMDEFRGYMYPEFTSLEDHVKHIAECVASGMDEYRYIEGYGDIQDQSRIDQMGIKWNKREPSEIELYEKEESVPR